MRGTEQGGFMSEEREKRGSERCSRRLQARASARTRRMGEPEDVEAHKLNERTGETERRTSSARRTRTTSRPTS